MFCTKCGKEIEDTSTFCKFCGAPVGNTAAAAPQSAPQPQPMPAQNNSVPQYGAPQPTVGAGLNLPSNTIDLIDLILRGLIAVSGLLVIIGCIGTMGTLNSMVNNALSSLFGGGDKLEKLAKAFYGFIVLIRVASIITFVSSLVGVVFTLVIKRKLGPSIGQAVIGTFIFIFHFIMFGLAGALLVGGAVAFGIILMLLALGLIGLSVLIVLKNGYIKSVFKK